MTVCADVYVRPQTCNTISIYPSQVHPHHTGSRSTGPVVYRSRRPLNDDEEVAIATALLMLG